MLAVEEYLHTSFDNPDPEFRDGELVQRAQADFEHARVHGALGVFFSTAHGEPSLVCPFD